MTNTLFQNEAGFDFSLESVRARTREDLEALEARRASSGLHAAPILGGKIHKSKVQWHREDPSEIDVRLGTVVGADQILAKQALDRLYSLGARWMSSETEHRVRLLERLAQRMREQRYALNALIIREAGKPWADADLEVCEAIDFCVYYAQEMRRLSQPELTMEVPGEKNILQYFPRGITLVIAPWNFPFAILCGMTVASLVAGNPTIIKPAEQSSLIGARFAELLLESGADPESFAFLPGRGEEIGPVLVNDPRVHTIVFTGSKAVGLHINELAAQVSQETRHVKRVIAEMGGKNAIIVDEDADMDEALKGVIQSAFTYAGQECSAASRIIVVGNAYEKFCERLAQAVQDIRIGSVLDGSVYLGPVIDHDAFERLKSQITQAKKEFSLLAEGKSASGGYFLPATVFSDVPEHAWLWREELFGPVLALRQAMSFEDALRQVNASPYKLTGGLYSRSPSHIERAYAEFDVGNLYINRKCTGALVCRQPFGGFGLSGVGSKAGGQDYLLQFLKPRVITENVLRRGIMSDNSL